MRLAQRRTTPSGNSHTWRSGAGGGGGLGGPRLFAWRAPARARVPSREVRRFPSEHCTSTQEICLLGNKSRLGSNPPKIHIICEFGVLVLGARVGDSQEVAGRLLGRRERIVEGYGRGFHTRPRWLSGSPAGHRSQGARGPRKKSARDPKAKQSVYVSLFCHQLLFR